MEIARGGSSEFESGIAVSIDDSSQIGEARRTAGAVAAASGLNETDAGKFALIATEAATNIAKHAERGEIVFRSIVANGARVAEIVAIDSGPGIADLDRAFRDGYSTAGSSGNGLGAISRLATEFDIFTGAGAGTVVAARVYGGGAPARSSQVAGIEVGVVRVPKRGEQRCGDDWALVIDDSGRVVLTLADGLGHGTSAADASRRAIEIAVERSHDQAGVIVGAIHSGLRATRGAAVAVAEINGSADSVRFAGLGNISAAIVAQRDSRSLVSHNGIAGHEMRKIQEFTYEIRSGALLIMHSDGVSARWDLSRYPGLSSRHPSVVAGVLYRDFSRGRDDALVVVVRVGG